MDWSNVLVVGGSVLGSMHETPNYSLDSDIDVYFYNISREAAQQKVMTGHAWCCSLKTIRSKRSIASPSPSGPSQSAWLRQPTLWRSFHALIGTMQRRTLWTFKSFWGTKLRPIYDIKWPTIVAARMPRLWKYCCPPIWILVLVSGTGIAVHWFLIRCFWSCIWRRASDCYS